MLVTLAACQTRCFLTVLLIAHPGHSSLDRACVFAFMDQHGSRLTGLPSGLPAPEHVTGPGVRAQAPQNEETRTGISSSGLHRDTRPASICHCAFRRAKFLKSRRAYSANVRLLPHGQSVVNYETLWSILTKHRRHMSFTLPLASFSSARKCMVPSPASVQTTPCMIVTGVPLVGSMSDSISK
jgi:hypothetical protein